MNFIKKSWFPTFGEIKIKHLNNKILILKASATNNNLVLNEIAITKLETRWYSVNRNLGGANLHPKMLQVFFQIP